MTTVFDKGTGKSFSRRGFLSASAVSCCATALPGGVSEQHARTDSGAVSVGFLSGTGHAPQALRPTEPPFPTSHLPDSRLEQGHRASVPILRARSLLSGDARFEETGAQVLIQGMHLPDRSLGREPLRRLSLWIHFPSAVERALSPAILAWHYAAEPIPSIAPATVHHVPVTEEGLVFGVTWTSAEGEHRAVVPLVTGGNPRAYKLQAGTYLIALGESPTGANMWRHHRWAESTEVPGGPGPCLVRGTLGGLGYVPVGFPYIVFTVEHAGALDEDNPVPA